MIPTAGRRRSCDRAGRPPGRAMAVGRAAAVVGLQQGCCRQGGNRVTAGRAGRTGALQGDVSRDDRARRGATVESVGCARWPGRATARQGNGRVATALEGGGVAGTRRRRRDDARGSQGSPGRTTAGTRRRRRDRTTARRDANAELGRARTVTRQGDGKMAARGAKGGGGA